MVSSSLFFLIQHNQKYSFSGGGSEIVLGLEETNQRICFLAASFFWIHHNQKDSFSRGKSKIVLRLDETNQQICFLPASFFGSNTIKKIVFLEEDQKFLWGWRRQIRGFVFFQFFLDPTQSKRVLLEDIVNFFEAGGDKSADLFSSSLFFFGSNTIKKIVFLEEDQKLF